MSRYTDNKRQMLALAKERGAAGFATSECADPGLVRTWVSELRTEDYEFVTFKLPGASEARYALAEHTGTEHDNYATLRASHPQATVIRDDRKPRKPRAVPIEASERADDARRNARRRATAFKRAEISATDLEIYVRGRRRLAESIENVTSIPPLLMSGTVPIDDVASLLEDLTELRAYTDTLISYIHDKVDDAAFAERLAKLRNVTGRPPEEAKAFLTAADKLEREREKRLSA
ncbi:hypothetical protein [Conexibacter woesei]|uniref:hypothetical protein n=1 Tax=Conexibacter woesei TaxID=191495 RepID=UPI000421FC3B|nr:hypothetical protein [Conexibacter woesei]